MRVLGYRFRAGNKQWSRFEDAAIGSDDMKHSIVREVVHTRTRRIENLTEFAG